MSLIVTSLYFVASIGASPTLNLTALHKTIAPTWVDEPSERGTWRILYSCTFTLVLCVYTAMHLNIPAHYDSKWKVRQRLAKWVAIAIFGPQVIVYVAFEQWYLARQFLNKLRSFADRSTDEEFLVRSESDHLLKLNISRDGTKLTQMTAHSTWSTLIMSLWEA